MPGYPGAEPGCGIAKTFADVAAPARSAPPDITTPELILAPFGAPAKLATGPGHKLFCKHDFPASAGLVRTADPGEVENLMDQDSFELARLNQQSGIEQDDPSWNVRGSQMRPQRAAELHSDGTAG